VLTSFPFVFPVDVRFRDLDALGHVNNAVYLTYLESARIAWWQEVSGRPLAQIGMILARTEIDYRSPAAYGERLEVGLRCASMGRSSFVMEFRMEERGSGARGVTPIGAWPAAGGVRGLGRRKRSNGFRGDLSR
jgi:acyl-CoA thioester hydrolase